jgi:hypothetical protein
MRQIGPQLETILAAFPPLYPDLFSLFLVLFLLVLEETHLLSLFLSFFVFNVLTKKKKIYNGLSPAFLLRVHLSFPPKVLKIL